MKNNKSQFVGAASEKGQRKSAGSSGTLDKLVALMRGHRNLEMWCSFPEQHPKLFYIWSSGIGPLADRGEPTLDAAINKFWNAHRRQHWKRSKPKDR